MKTGKLRIVFNGMAFIGADSDKALRTAIAAGQENHLWDVVHGLYTEPGPRERAAGSRTSSSPRSRPGFPASTEPRSLTPAGRARSSQSWSGLPQRRRRPASTAHRPSRSARPVGGWSAFRSARWVRRESFRRSRRCWRDERAHASTRERSRLRRLERRSPGTCSTCGRPAARSSARPAAARRCRARPMPRCSACRSRGSASLGFLGLLAAALAPRRVGADEPGHARALGVPLQRLPALHPGGRDRGDLPVVPRDRRHHDRDRRLGAPAPSPRRGGRAYSAATNAPASEAPADRRQEAEARRRARTR